MCVSVCRSAAPCPSPPPWSTCAASPARSSTGCCRLRTTTFPSARRLSTPLSSLTEPRVPGSLGPTTGPTYERAVQHRRKMPGLFHPLGAAPQCPRCPPPLPSPACLPQAPMPPPPHPSLQASSRTLTLPPPALHWVYQDLLPLPCTRQGFLTLYAVTQSPPRTSLYPDSTTPWGGHPPR